MATTREQMLLEMDTRYNDSGMDEANERMDAMAQHLEDVAEAGEEAEDASDETSNAFSAMGQSAFVAIGILGTLAGALAGVFGGSIGLIEDWNSAFNMVEAQTGLTGAALADFEDQAEDVFLNNWGDNIQDVADSMSQVARITGTAGDELEDMTTKALIMRSVFDSEVTESTRAADVMMEQFGIDGARAFDLLTRGMQLTGDPGQDLLDTFNEYSGNLAEMGLSAEQALAILNSGLEGGARNTDDIGDALREFQIRMKENPAIFEETFASINDEGFFEDFRGGFADGADALGFTLDALRQIEDPIERNAAGVAVFGSRWEDMGEAAFLAMDLTTDQLGEIEGATDRAGAAVSQGLGPAIEQLKRAGTVLLVEFLEPYVLTFTQAAIPAMEQFGEWLRTEGVPGLEMLALHIGAVGQFLSELSPESVLLIAAAFAIMVGPAILAGMAAMISSIAAMTVAFAPLAIAMGLVVAYETDFGGLKTSIQETKAAIEEGDTAGALRGIAGAMSAIPVGAADEVLKLANADIDSKGGWWAWKENFRMIGILASDLPEKFTHLLGFDFTVSEGLQAWVGVFRNAWTILTLLPGYIAGVLGIDFSVSEGLAAWQGIFQNVSTLVSELPGKLLELASSEISIPEGLQGLFDTLQNILPDISVERITVWVEDLKTKLLTGISSVFGGGDEEEGGGIGELLKTAFAGLANIADYLPTVELSTLANWVQSNLIDPVVNKAKELEALFKGAINAAVPDSFGFQLFVDLPSPIPDIDEWIGVNLPNPFPGYAVGGVLGSGEMVMVGERGPELFVAPSVGRIVPNQSISQFEGGGSQQSQPQEVVIPVTLELDGRVLYETVVREGKKRA